MEKVVITGGSGAIGLHLTKLLVGMERTTCTRKGLLQKKTLKAAIFYPGFATFGKEVLNLLKRWEKDLLYSALEL